MDHHFIPQFYLRRFRDPNVPDGQEPWLWIVDFEEGTVERRAPKNVGKKANYYAFPEVDTVGESIESGLSKMESAAAPLIKKLVIADDAALEGQDRTDLLYFMAFFAVRVPFFRNMVEKFAGDAGKRLLQISAGHPEHFERTIREALKGEDVTPEQIEDMRQLFLDDSGYTMRASPKLSLGAGFEAAMDTVYPVFAQMRWAVLRAGETLRYVTSDAPVSWVDPTMPPPFAYGLATREVEVTFPLDPTVCVFGTWEGPTGAITVTDRTVEQFNTRRVAFSDRYVFADTEKGARSALDLGRKMEKCPSK